MKAHSELFEKTVAYPSTNFPGRTQEGLLGQLLRKKLEPGVERWVDEGKAIVASEQGQGDSEVLEEQWKAARDFIGERVARAAVTHRRDMFTAEEREMGIHNVRTGLSKPMKLLGEESSSESDEDESEDEEMADVDAKKGAAVSIMPKIEGPVRSLDEIVRFMTVGLAPEDEVQTNLMGFRR